MILKPYRPIIFLLCLFMLAANTSAINAKTNDTTVFLQPDDLPEDIKLIAKTSVDIMKHRDINGSLIEIVSGAKRILREPDFSYKGFKVSHIYIIRYTKAGSENSRLLKFALRFDDIYGRSILSTVSVIYRYLNGKFRIEYAMLREQCPTKPTVQTFIVPASKIPKNLRKITKSYIDLYRFVVKNSLSLSKRSRLSKKKRRYIVFAFVGERMPPDAHIDLVLDSKEKGISGNSYGMKRLDFKGWHVMTLPVRLALRASPSYFLKLIYHPCRRVAKTHHEKFLLASYRTSEGKPVLQTVAVRKPVSSEYTSAKPVTAYHAGIEGKWHIEPEYGFKIKVPSRWRFSTMQDGSDRVVTLLSSDGNVAARVRAIPVPPGISAKKVLRAFEQNIIAGSKRIAIQKDTVNGMRGIATAYSGNFERTKVGIGVFTTVQGKYAYILWGMIPLRHFERRSNEVDAVFNSFILLQTH